MQQRQAGGVPHARLHTQETEGNVHTGLCGVSLHAWALYVLLCTAGFSVVGVARGGDILPVIGGLALLSVTAFTHRVPEMASVPDSFLDITQCPLGTKSGSG